jgi:hypothetical protein
MRTKTNSIEKEQKSEKKDIFRTDGTGSGGWTFHTGGKISDGSANHNSGK